MTFISISVPAALATKTGAAHRAKLAAVERRMNARTPGAHFDLRRRLNAGSHEILIGASERLFFGDSADRNLRAAFAAAL